MKGGEHNYLAETFLPVSYADLVASPRGRDGGVSKPSYMDLVLGKTGEEEADSEADTDDSMDDSGEEGTKMILTRTKVIVDLW